MSRFEDPKQTAFEFDELSFSIDEAHTLPQIKEAPKLSLPPEFVPVYTVYLRRSDIITVRQRPTIHSPHDVATLLWDYLKETDREHFVVLFLDTKNTVIGLNTVSIGILDSALVHPREVYKAAILANAAAIIVGHNHPSGDPTPSAEDRRVTERLREGGQLLGIELLDHVVVGEKGRFVSLKERGML